MTKLLIPCLGLAVLSVGWCAAFGGALPPLLQEGKVLVVPRGGKAQVADFVTAYGKPVHQATSAAVSWDDDGMSVSFRCTDADVQARLQKRDHPGAWRNDEVEVFLDLGHSHDIRARYYHVIVTAAGGVFDEDTGDVAFDLPGLVTHADRTAEGWCAEVHIPWEGLGARPEVGDAWGLNLNRIDRPGEKLVCWSPTGGRFHSIQHWGHIVFAGPSGESGQAKRHIQERHAEIMTKQIRVQDYARRVARGEGFMPWQSKEKVSEAERGFRAKMEARKDEMLAGCMPVRHPVWLSDATVEQARRNIDAADWAREWWRGAKKQADYVAAQSDEWIESMIPELTPTNPYGLTCPNCVGTRSQEGLAYRHLDWDYRNPDVIRCRACGQTYPDPQYPETGRLVCPRSGQELTFHINEDERAQDDLSGGRAWRWVGRPIHSSFAGVVRARKVAFMSSATYTLALAYRLTGEVKYAASARRILLRLASCYRRWLYHDYWDTIADCDPLYAAWHGNSLPLEWKRHPCAEGYEKDTHDSAAMLQSYWGAGRTHPSTDAVARLRIVCEAYDAVCTAENRGGRPLWSEEDRAQVERDLILEYVMGAEPFVGGAGRARLTNNKAPSVYMAQAAVARCLGLAGYADTALRGYEAVRDRSFLYDGFSRESPAYTNMYLGSLIQVPEALHGFRWPKGIEGRSGTVNVYRDDVRLALIMRAAVETLRPDGCYLPLSDTLVDSGASGHIMEIGLNRYSQWYRGRVAALLRDGKPSVYSVLHNDDADLAGDEGLDLPEFLFPAWQTAILRHGRGADGTVLALPLNPDGGHRHSDNLALYYFDRGRAVLGDQGYVGDSPMNGWIHSTFSHNLVIVDDQDQRRKERVPSLRMMASGGRVSVVEAESKAYEQCSVYRRLIALVKGPGAETFAVDVFRVRGGGRHDWRLFSEIGASDAPESGIEFGGLDMPPEASLPDYAGSVKGEHIYGLQDVRTVADPPDAWQATWRQKGRRYRLRFLSPADRVEASHGPGQEDLDESGRRVRYLDVINQGKDVESVFVAIHEPSGPRGSMPIKRAERLAVPKAAGPNAVAVRIESKWGTYLVLSEFARETEVAGVRFKGAFGIVCETPQGGRWLMSVGAAALAGKGFGFENAPAEWSGAIEKHTDDALRTDTPRPKGWPQAPAGVTPYVLTGGGRRYTGFPVCEVGAKRIAVERFPLQPAKRFRLPAVQYMEH